MKTLCYIFSGLLVFLAGRVTSQEVTRYWEGMINNVFTEPGNWNPPGRPESTHVVIPQRTIFPVLSNPSLFAPLRSVTILNGGRFDIILTGRLTTMDSIRVATGGTLNIGSIDSIQIGKKWIIDSGAVVSISSAINVTSIGDNVVLNGMLTIGAGVSANIWCNGNWIRGPGSAFSAGNSTFYFVNTNRQLTIDRGTFYNLILGPVQAHVRIAGNVNVNNALIIRDSVIIAPRDTLTVNNRNAIAVNYLPGGLILRGSVRRLLDPASLDTIRFHDRDIAVQFRNTSGIPNSITITSEPDTEFVPCQLRFVRRFYDISTQGTGFAARLFLRYDQRDLMPSVTSEDSLRLWRSLDGCTWDPVQSRVDTVRNVVIADSVTQFSKWGFGAPNSSPIAQATSNPHLPLATQLSQNFPNPFNPSTRIQYTLASTEVVSLKVFNILGQEIATLVNESQIPGRYEVNWKAENYPSGVYVYRLQTGKQTLSRKMVLLR